MNDQSDLTHICKTVYVQPHNSNMCGQYTVAHLCDIEPKAAISVFKLCNPRENLKEGTKTKHVHKALEWLGWDSPKFMKLLKPGQKPPPLCLLNIRWIAPGTYEHGTGHWVLYNRGFVVCSGPDRAGIYKLNEYLRDRKGVCISFLEVKKRD